MADAALIWSPQNGWADVAISAGDLVGGADLEAAATISLFSDRIAAEEDVIPDGSGDPRGFWADAFATYPIGSRLWQLERGKATPDVLQKAKDIANEAFAWMISEALCSSVSIATEFIRKPVDGIGFDIVIQRVGKPPVALKFAWAWQGVG